MKKIDYTPKVQRNTVKRFGKGPVPSGIKPWTPIDSTASVRATQSIRSLSTPGGSTALKPAPQYTGEKMLGVAVMHKSCLQPIFNQEAAVDVAKMRR
jgi:hypothetical protein